MKINRSVRKISNVIWWLVVLLLLVGTVGFLYKYTNGFKEDVSTFYVEYDGETVLNEAHVKFLSGGKYRFEVKNAFDVLSDEKKEFDVTVKSYVTNENDFVYRVNGIDNLYSDVGDLTDCFDISIDENGFDVTAPVSILDVLQKRFPDKDVTIDDFNGTAKELFVITVTSSDGQTVNVYVALELLSGPTEIKFDKTELIF